MNGLEAVLTNQRRAEARGHGVCVVICIATDGISNVWQANGTEDLLHYPKMLEDLAGWCLQQARLCSPQGRA